MCFPHTCRFGSFIFTHKMCFTSKYISYHWQPHGICFHWLLLYNLDHLGNLRTAINLWCGFSGCITHSLSLIFGFVPYTNNIIVSSPFVDWPSTLGTKHNHNNKLTMDSFYSLLVITPKNRIRTCIIVPEHMLCLLSYLRSTCTFQCRSFSHTTHERRFHRWNQMWAKELSLCISLSGVFP